MEHLRLEFSYQYRRLLVSKRLEKDLSSLRIRRLTVPCLCVLTAAVTTSNDEKVQTIAGDEPLGDGVRERVN